VNYNADGSVSGSGVAFSQTHSIDFDTLTFSVTGNIVESVGVILGTPEGDYILGTEGSDEIYGLAGDDRLLGLSGDDSLFGGDGNDWLNGGDGNDYLNPGENVGGYSGFDGVEGSLGSDIIDLVQMVNGYVTLSYAGMPNSILVYLDQNAAQMAVEKVGVGIDIVASVGIALDTQIGGLGVFGTSFDDTFEINTSDGQWLQLRGGPGSDIYKISGNGFLRLDYRLGEQGVVVDLTDGIVYNDGFGGVDLIFGSVSELVGTDHSDIIFGSFSDEFFFSMGGTDFLDGGGGFDFIRYNRPEITGGVNVNLDGSFAEGVWVATPFLHELQNFEGVIGSSSHDSIIGSKFDDVIVGGNGDDYLYGGEGRDIIDGGRFSDPFFVSAQAHFDGNDTLTGGAGADIFIFSGDFGHDLVTDFNAGEDVLEFYSADGAILDISALLESLDQSGNRVLSTIDMLSSVTLLSTNEPNPDASLTRTTVTHRFGQAMSDAEVATTEIINGKEIFLRAVGSTEASTLYELVALPTSNMFTLDFEFTDNVDLIGFQLGKALAGWTIQSNTAVANTLTVSGFGALNGSQDIVAGFETVLATFETVSNPNVDVTGIFTNGVAQQGISIRDVPATSKLANVTVHEVANGADAYVVTDMAVDLASENAVGAFDALQALRLAVGLTKSNGTAEWHDYFAADINKDGRVGADDALNILKYAVGLTDGPSADWVFVDSNGDYSGVTRQNSGYDEGIYLENVITDTPLHLTAILVGDVDGSYVV
jgi:Ca2+-binding RTX toxin-like protein